MLKDWLPGIVLAVLSATLVALIGMLMAVDGGHTIAGPLVVLVGLTAVAFGTAFWAADRVQVAE